MTLTRINAGRLACALLASTASIAIIAAPAAAQQVAEKAYPMHDAVDENGVDVASGQFVTKSSEVSIGDEESGLRFRRQYRGNSYQDNLLGTLIGSTVSFDGITDEFVGYSNGVYTPREPKGQSLTYANGVLHLTT